MCLLKKLCLLVATAAPLLLAYPSEAAKNNKPKGANPVVRMTTSLGVIEVKLAAKRAPVTTENFLRYVREGLYDGTVFHRVIPGFMVQGGGFEPRMKRRPTHDPINNEADNGLKNVSGAIAMARTADPHSATSQFFINTADNENLNHTGKTGAGWGYAVFGKVIKGMDVVKKIEAVPTTTVGPYRNVPKNDVLIQKMEVIRP
jgi:cyclophilin family peptidyl-prolyl cis-trans isomerase